jgi:hypothetical protein
MTRLRLLTSLMILLISCGRGTDLEQSRWVEAASREIEKCPIEWKRQKASDLLKFGAKTGMHVEAILSFDKPRRLFIQESTDTDQNEYFGYELLVKSSDDSTIFNFKFDPQSKTIVKSIVREDALVPDYYRELFSNFESGLICAQNSTVVEVSFVLELR